MAAISFLLPGMNFACGQLAVTPDLAHPVPAAKAAPDAAGKPAEALYLELRSVGLDPARTFHIRNASIDRSAMHVTLEDGEISFTAAVNGHITGAFFEGNGEVLLRPPNQVERGSLALFTGMAILEERFNTGYLRFNDDTFAELQPYLRPSDVAKEFSSHWNETAHNLAEGDALRLLATFSRSLPVPGESPTVPPSPKPHLIACCTCDCKANS